MKMSFASPLVYGFLLPMVALMWATPAEAGNPAIDRGSKVTDAICDSGGILLLHETGRTRLEPWGDGVIRVQFTPARGLPGPASSAVLPEAQIKVKWTALTNDPEKVVLITPRLRAEVQRATGAVTFFDEAGKLLVGEPEGGGKSMEPVVVANEPGWLTEQSFVSPADEALYGLGGYWHGILNHKGDMVRLAQSNPCDTSPVLLSSRGYLMLWDNPAIGEFRACREPSPIPAEAMRLPDNSGPGMQVDYYKEASMGTLLGSGTNSSISCHCDALPVERAQLGSPQGFGIRWKGKLQIAKEGEYLFLLRSTGRGRLILDRKLAVENWIEHGPEFDTGKIFLEAGDHELQAELAGTQPGAAIDLRWIPAGEPKPDRYTWQAGVSKAIDYYVVRAQTMDQGIAEYRRLTGVAPMFPKSAYGFWHSQASWPGKPSIPNTQANMMAVAEGYRQRQIPIDNIVQDFQYWSKMGQHDFRPDTHPDPAGMMKQLKALNYKVMFAIWCIFQPGKPNHDEMLNKGYILNPGNNGEWYNPFNPPPGGQEWYDAWNPHARATYWRQLRDGLFDPSTVKADAFWIDSTEGLPLPWKGNEYPLVSTQAVYEGWRQTDPDDRVFILTRSLFPGMQRNASALWSGDIGTDIWTMANQIPNGLGVCLTGLPYWTTDVGGFGGGFSSHPEFSYRNDPKDPRYNETYVRWMQYGAFCPLFRIHTAGAHNAPWEFGPKSEAICTDFIRLRYRLLPYIYSLAWRVTNAGDTMMRALPMDFPDDPRVSDIKDQFLFGPELLVNPITTLGATTREVYLPKGNWTDFWTGESHPGEQTLSAQAPIERLPLFVRAGSILPMGPVIQYTDEKPQSSIELRIYPGADGSFTLYDDDGKTYGYQRHEYSEVPIQWNDNTRTLSFGKRVGRFPGMLEKIEFRVVLVRPGTGVGGAECQQPDKILAYRGQPQVVEFRK